MRNLLLSALLFNAGIHADPSFCNSDLDHWLACNNPKVMAYLNRLDSARVGNVIDGLRLSDNTLVLNGLTYLGRGQAPAGVHIFLFKRDGRSIAYLWVDQGAKTLALPACADTPLGSAHLLSGDVYTWSAAQPGHGVIIVECVATAWRSD